MKNKLPLTLPILKQSHVSLIISILLIVVVLAFSIIIIKENEIAGLKEKLNNNTSTTEQTETNEDTDNAANNSKLIIEDLEECYEPANVNKEISSFVTTDEGKVFMVQTENINSGTEPPYVTNCKHTIIGETNNTFSPKEDGKSVNVYAYYRREGILEIYDLSQFPHRGFFNLKTSEVLLPKLPEIVGNGQWEFSSNYENDYVYYLITPAVYGGCGVGEEGEKCMEELTIEAKDVQQKNPIYLFRSDGKTAKLIPYFPSSNLKLDFSYTFDSDNNVTGEYVSLLDNDTEIKKYSLKSLFK